MTNTDIIKREAHNVYDCGHCGGTIIIGETEVNGRLYIKNGVPICAVCRVLKAPNGGRIRADKSKVKQDVLNRRAHEEAVELDRIFGIAAESQLDAPRLADADRPRIII